MGVQLYELNPFGLHLHFFPLNAALCGLPVGQKFQPFTLFLQRGQISIGPLSYDYLNKVQMVKISITYNSDPESQKKLD